MKLLYGFKVVGHKLRRRKPTVVGPRKLSKILSLLSSEQLIISSNYEQHNMFRIEITYYRINLRWYNKAYYSEINVVSLVMPLNWTMLMLSVREYGDVITVAEVFCKLCLRREAVWIEKIKKNGVRNRSIVKVTGKLTLLKRLWQVFLKAIRLECLLTWLVLFSQSSSNVEEIHLRMPRPIPPR